MMIQQYRMIDPDGHELSPWRDLHYDENREFTDGVHYEFREKPVAPLKDGVYVTGKSGDLCSVAGRAYLRYKGVWYLLTPNSNALASGARPSVDPVECMDDNIARQDRLLRFVEAED
jgi:hypothetical protein